MPAEDANIIFNVIFLSSVVSRNAKRQRRPGITNSVCMKPRGLPNGLKRTPTCIGDEWQNHTSYDVEEVRKTVYMFPCILVFTSLAYTDLLALNSDRFCFRVRQILADNLIKS